MSLGTPWMLLLLPLVALVGWLMARSRRLQYDAACRLRGVAAESRRGSLMREDRLALAALLCVVVALARPHWNPRPYDIERRGRDLVVALDVSRSMLAADVFPSRLENARIAIHEALPAWAGQRVALVTFAGSASVRVPLTSDHEFVRYMLERAEPSDVDVGSTSLQAAFEKVTSTVLADATRGGRDLVVFTDGEDHLSDLGRTAEMLTQCGARVLIVGLGDPVRGARVPDPRDGGQWMRHNNVEVVSRLDEKTLSKLADPTANVTYFPARTRPFDLVRLYRQWIVDAGDDVVVGGLRRVRYTEGYPYLLALAVALWLSATRLGNVPTRSRPRPRPSRQTPSQTRPLRGSKLPKTSLAKHGSANPTDDPASIPDRPGMPYLLLLALFFSGCSEQAMVDDMAAFRARVEHGRELLAFAQEQSSADVLAERSLLLDAREEFLRAALLQPGDLETARQITTITQRLRALEVEIEAQRDQEKQQHEKLAETIRRLEKLSLRQDRLAQRSRRALRSPPVPTGEAANLPESMVANEEFLPEEELTRLARPLAADQKAVRKETESVLDGITGQRDTLREILAQAYGNVENLPPTEVDPVVDLLSETVVAQDEALANLAPGSVVLPRANTALHTAAGRMEQALDALRSLQPPATEDQDDAMASRRAGDLDEELEVVGAESQGKGSQPVPAGDFQETLLLQTLPIPDYTSAEIMAEEAANQKKRARRKAARAGAKVEKNW